jgi:hypothetical protein
VKSDVATIVSAAPNAHAQARGGKAAIAQALARLGPSATQPILEQFGSVTHPIVRRDLIEALGILADPKAVPLLASIIVDTKEDAETTRTTSEALARIGRDDAILSALKAATGDRERAIVAGMGECRKLPVTRELATRVKTGDDAMVRAAARAMGRNGNAWAWKTLADRTDEGKIRDLAARALLESFIAHDGETRQAAANAVLVVDAPSTSSIMVELRPKVSPATQAALDELSARFAKNPVR